MYMMYEHNMCAMCVAQEEITTLSLSLSLSLWPNKEMLKNCYAFSFTPTLSLYIYVYIYIYICIYIYIYTRMRTHKIWQCGLRLIAWRKLWFLHRVTLLSAAQPAGLTYTQTNTQQLVLHPTPSSTRFKSRRGNLNTEFHVFLRNVCPIHFGMCIHKLPLLFAVTKP